MVSNETEAITEAQETASVSNGHDTPSTPHSRPRVRRSSGRGATAAGASNAPAATVGARKAPRQRDRAMLDDFGLKLGTSKAQAAAMYARAMGATLAEVKAVVGSVQFNVLTELEGKGFAIKRIPEENGGRKHTRYFLHA